MNELVERIKAPKPEPGAVWCRNVMDVAKAIGLRLYDAKTRLKRGQQLEDVRALTGCHDFPAQCEGVKGKAGMVEGLKGEKVKREKKRPKYWARAEVVAWAARNLILSKNGREFELKVEGRRLKDENTAPSGAVTAIGELPAQASAPGPEAELFEPAPAQFEKTLDLWQEKLANPDKWLMAPIQAWQLKELKKHRPDLFGAPAPDTFQGGLEAVAAYIQMKFPGVVCNKQDISNWRKNKYLPSGCQEPFPPSHESGRNYKAPIEAWVVKYLKPAALEQNLPMRVDDRGRKEKADADMAEMERDRIQKKTSGLYVLTEMARRTGTAIGSVAMKNCREALERQLPRRFEGAIEGVVTDVALRGRVLDCLRLAAVETFGDWQRQTGEQLRAMVGGMKSEG